MKLAPHKPIREQYNPNPNAGERRHHMRVMQLACLGCGVQPCGVAHHVLENSPVKRWRRDHRIVIPVCHGCHVELHSAATELKWRPNLHCPDEAHFLWIESINEGIA